MGKVENEIIEFWVENGIMFSRYKKPVNLTLQDAKDIVELRHEISKGEHQLWCYDFNGVKSYRKEVRDYADIHGQEYLHATAAVINSNITNFILNTFLKIKRPKVPLKAFKTEAEAIEWLKSFKST